MAVKSLRDKPPEVCLHRIFPTKSDSEWTTSAGSSVAANDVALVGPECSIEQQPLNMFLSLLLEWHSRQVPFSLLAKKVVPKDFLDTQMLVTDSGRQ